MPTFELTLKGQDGNEATDHLVKWVRAVDEDALLAFLRRYNLCDLLVEHPFPLEAMGILVEMTKAEGLDAEIDGDGWLLWGDDNVEQWPIEVALQHPSSVV